MKYLSRALYCMQFAFCAAWPMPALVSINFMDITFGVKDYQWTNGKSEKFIETLILYTYMPTPWK